MEFIRAVDHVGITVPNLEAAVIFFREAFGYQELYRLGPFEADDDWMTRRLGVHPRARIPQVADLERGSGARLELFHYETPDQNTDIPRNSDLSGHHIAFSVDDMAVALSHLRHHGGEVMDEPTVVATGPSAGETWVYVRAPWGLQLELVHRRSEQTGAQP